LKDYLYICGYKNIYMKKHICILMKLLRCNTQYLQQKTGLRIFKSSHFLIINNLNIIIHFQNPDINSLIPFCLCKRIIYCIYAKTDYY
jgi:hypothetical protein